MNIFYKNYQITRQVFLTSLLILLSITGTLNQETYAAEVDNKRTLSPASQKKLLANMAWVEGGEFVMGSDSENARNREKPAHKVTLNGFYMGKTEVTSKLWEEVMG